MYRNVGTKPIDPEKQPRRAKILSTPQRRPETLEIYLHRLCAACAGVRVVPSGNSARSDLFEVSEVFEIFKQ
jgi:hypothetical protein